MLAQPILASSWQQNTCASVYILKEENMADTDLPHEQLFLATRISDNTTVRKAPPRYHNTLEKKLYTNKAVR